MSDKLTQVIRLMERESILIANTQSDERRQDGLEYLRTGWYTLILDHGLTREKVAELEAAGSTLFTVAEFDAVAKGKYGHPLQVETRRCTVDLEAARREMAEKYGVHNV